MFETWSYRKMAMFVIALIGISVLIFVFEEVTEEGEYGGFEIKSNLPAVNAIKPEAESTVTAAPPPLEKSASAEGEADSDCYTREPFMVVQRCVKCSDFETRAIKAKHCVDTGYFDRLNCTKSGRFALRSCRRKKDATIRFNVFGVFSFVIAVLSYFASSHRKFLIQGHAYSRLQQQLS